MTEQHAVSAEFDPTIEADEVKPSNAMTNEGYDEAVEQGEPFTAEPEILAEDSADPVALTEADPISEDELLLQEAGRDLRPDTITPSPDITSTGAAMIEAAGKVGEGEPPVEEEAGVVASRRFRKRSVCARSSNKFRSRTALQCRGRDGRERRRREAIRCFRRQCGPITVACALA